jgi:hypothetical protein
MSPPCLTGQWAYEKDGHCENKNRAGNFLHVSPPCFASANVFLIFVLPFSSFFH